MRRVLIANRGEIALRAIRACRRLGLQSVAVQLSSNGNERLLQRAEFERGEVHTRWVEQELQTVQ